MHGDEPPSSPGFIPRFSFQDKSAASEHYDQRARLNTAFNKSSVYISNTNWEDDEYEHAAIAASHKQNTFLQATAPMAMHDSTLILAPALSHTHSSNRARGKRTSYTSLHAVAEVAEPGDEMTESPILGRRYSPPKTGPRRPSLPTSMNMPPNANVGSIQRKPLPTCPPGGVTAVEAASRLLLRPTLVYKSVDYSGSSSSGLVMSSISSDSGVVDETDSPVSLLAHHALSNPFTDECNYLEGYGPEYSQDCYNGNDNELHGGNRSLDRYPDPLLPRMTPKTEWPLKNVVDFGRKRSSSSMWDRVYESN